MTTTKPPATPLQGASQSAGDKPQRRPLVLPVVNRARCEGKGDCVRVCPYDVFELGQMTDEDYAALAWPFKLKASVHGRKTVYTPNAEACRACGLCVQVCPERALSLVRRASIASREPEPVGEAVESPGCGHYVEITRA